MKSSFVITVAFVVAASCLLTWRSASAQVSGSTVPSNPTGVQGLPLAEMSQEKESIYQTKLRSLHGPILQEYLTELKSLLAKTEAPTDSDMIKAEITRVEKQIADGFMDLSPHQAVSVSIASEKRSSLFTLEPSDASTPTVTNAAGEVVTPIGKTSWTLSKLPAGSYKFTVTYSCSKLPPASALKVEFAGASFKHELSPDSATLKDGVYRPLRIPFVVAADATLQPLTLSLEGAGDAPLFFIRRIIISRDADK